MGVVPELPTLPGLSGSSCSVISANITMAKYGELDIQREIYLVKSGYPLRKAAQEVGVPHRTLAYRLKLLESMSITAAARI